MIRVNYEEATSEKLKELVNAQESFEIIGLAGKIRKIVEKVENAIESNGYRCRIYTYGRVAAAGASFFGGITGLLGIGSAAAMAAHNLATLNPDFEVAKHPIDNMVSVKYCK